ncbi:MAG: hypothetical protein HQK86_01335 [Nitrospinae bacterium]|nr:hypothetical protein [Nitrospinota bacterium]
MSIINMAEVKSKIAFHEAQIRALESLLQIGHLLSDKETPAPKKTRGPKPGSKRKGGKRGMLTGAITALLENSASPLLAGDIKRAIVEQGVVDKKSTSVYATLLQMASRGTINKIKTAGGMAYSAAGSGSGSAKPKRRKAKSGKGKKAATE